VSGFPPGQIIEVPSLNFDAFSVVSVVLHVFLKTSLAVLGSSWYAQLSDLFTAPMETNADARCLSNMKCFKQSLPCLHQLLLRHSLSLFKNRKTEGTEHDSTVDSSHSTN